MTRRRQWRPDLRGAPFAAAADRLVAPPELGYGSGARPGGRRAAICEGRQAGLKACSSSISLKTAWTIRIASSDAGAPQ